MLLRNKQKLQFSILVFCNGRWTTHTNLTDKDLAIKRAREMAKTDRSAEAIRVMQYQNNIRGGRIETELLHIDRPEAHQSQAYQVGFVEAVDVCNSIDDFFKLDARRATEALLRAPTLRLSLVSDVGGLELVAALAPAAELRSLLLGHSQW